MRIAALWVARHRLPLTRPYSLSFTHLEQFDSVVVEARLDDGGVGIGEATALPGYGCETAEDIEQTLRRATAALHGLDLEEARHQAARLLPAHSFAPSALFTALDVAEGRFPIPDRVEVPCLSALGVAPPSEMLSEAEALVEQGYTTLKVKVGRRIEDDIAAARTLVAELPTGVVLRFDANQGYDEGEALRFLRSLDAPGADRVELVEQPLPVEAWTETKAITACSPVPLMLDEAIYDETDVARAAEVGARYVKLKLVKHRGLHETLRLARAARSAGLGVVLGNGVASDVTNVAEAWIYSAEAGLFAGACESVGFLRLHTPLLATPPTLRHGHLLWHRPDTAPLRLSELLPTS